MAVPVLLTPRLRLRGHAAGDLDATAAMWADEEVVRDITGRLDLDALAPVPTDTLELNDIGRVTLRLASPVAPDDYTVSRRTGSFLLVDPQTGGTLAAGMVRAFGDFDEAAEQAATVNWSI